MKNETHNSSFVSDFLKRFQKFLVKECEYLKDNQVLVTVSGGIDSVVMMDLFSRSKFSYEIAHVNFKLRGIESDKDEEFVNNLSKLYKVEINTISFDTEKYAKSRGISIEMAARELRYKYFNELISEKKLDLIATAHHLDDNLETIILNFSRGTTLKGYHGIRPKSSNLIRPMMFASKMEIKKYASELNLDFRIDCSNTDIRFKRNLIRKSIVPELKKLNPGVLETVYRAGQFMTEYERIVSTFIIESLKRIVTSEGNTLVFDLQALRQIGHIKVLIFETLKEYGFSMEHVEKIYQLIENETGSSFFLMDYWIYRDRHKLIVNKASSVKANVTMVLKNTSLVDYGDTIFKIDTILPDEIEDLKNPNLAFLDKEKLKFPLQIRSWKDGDRFWPCGMQGTKKISDYFTDQKISLHKKQEIPIFESDGKVVWLAGFRIDEDFKITEQTLKVLRIEIINKTI